MTPGTISYGDAGRAQRLRLLAAAAEEQRIAALEAHDGGAAAAVLDQLLRRLVLRQRDAPGCLPASISRQPGRREVEQRVAGEAVVDDHVGAPQELLRRAP